MPGHSEPGSRSRNNDPRLVPVGGPRPTYRPRDPRSTSLHRILVDHLETLLAVHEDRFESRFGYLPSIVDSAARAYIECGLFSAGCARVRCPDCGHEFLLPFFAEVANDPEAKPGIISVTQTFNSDLTWNSHAQYLALSTP